MKNNLIGKRLDQVDLKKLIGKDVFVVADFNFIKSNPPIYFIPKNGKTVLLERNQSVWTPSIYQGVNQKVALLELMNSPLSNIEILDII